jgi:hypothetical protein
MRRQLVASLGVLLGLAFLFAVTELASGGHLVGGLSGTQRAPTRPKVLAYRGGTRKAEGRSFPAAIRTVFLIVFENHDWSQIQGNVAAPYINSLLRRPDASYATQYFTPPGNHPSEPNYIWLEGGGAASYPDANFGETISFVTDDPPSAANSTSTHLHLTALLMNAHVSWRAYQEGIDGRSCPLLPNAVTLYSPKHNPMVFFQDVTGNNNPLSRLCITHERPLAELAADLVRNRVARYNFITPNLCDDMHNGSGCATPDPVRNGDVWLSRALPPILRSRAYRDGGAVLITWDEGSGGSDGPIGMIVLSPEARGHGYHNALRYTHSSTLRTLQEIFGAYPFLRNAARSNDLRDLFQSHQSRS